MKQCKAINPFVWLVISLLMSTVLITKSYAQSTGWLENPNHPPVKLRFMLTGEYDAKSKTLPALLEIKLSGDWKTYWRSPGEGGISPSIDWQDSTNVANVEWFWPVPEQFSLLGLKTLGYKKAVTFPMLLTLDDAQQQSQLRGKLTLSSCTNICVLTDYDIALDLDLKSLKLDSEAMLAYHQAKSKVPVKVSDNQAISLGWDKSKTLLRVVLSNNFSTTPRVLIDGEPDTVFTLQSIEQQNLENGTKKLVAIFNGESWLGDPKLVGKSLNVSLISDQSIVEYQVNVEQAQITVQQIPLLKILIFALLGGLILNVMPCVLPVLGMKLSTIITAGQVARSDIRRQFIASALGILVSFWLLATFILILKITGQAIGWGIQFQNPWFIGFMVIITAVFALNMLGVFEISLPSSLQTKLATTGDNHVKGHFLQGMFATLLATPCSAPFLGTAVAFAFGADTLSLFVVFTALAVGMALPWIIIAAFPQLALFFPKPGKWMNSVKISFSMMLLLTSLWLISLLSSFVSSTTLMVIAVLLLLVYLYFLAKSYGKKAVVASCSVLIIISMFTALLTTNQWSKALPTDLTWQPLNVEKINDYVSEGKTVFVDVTADWCITCKANKVGVVLQDPVYSQLKQDHVILMKGDWTTPSAEITEYLQSYHQFGVPFNIVYGPNAPKGIALSTVLSSKKVLEAMAKAE